MPSRFSPPAFDALDACTTSALSCRAIVEGIHAQSPPRAIVFVSHPPPKPCPHKPPPRDTATNSRPANPPPSNWYAPNVSDATPIASMTATTPNFGTAHLPFANETVKVASSTTMEACYAVIGKNLMDVTSPTNLLNMTALDVATTPMVLRNVIESSLVRAVTPYRPDAWQQWLSKAHLEHRYPNIYNGLHYGFSANLPPLSRTFSPPNDPSISEHGHIFEEIVNREFTKGRYHGPFSQMEIEAVLGPFQIAPLSLIPKPSKPGKFRLVQNLSFPHSNSPIPSINSLVNPDDFPSPYSTFSIVALVISALPPGSQGAIRDVAEAYRTIPLHPSQWHALVVRLSKSHFAIDTSTCFGFGPSDGIYGNLGSAGTDIMHFAGVGPILRWVDDHLFLRIPKSELTDYNQHRKNVANRITLFGGVTTRGGCSWFAGAPLPCGSIEEFDEDHTFPLQDLSNLSPQPKSEFCYNIEDIN